NRHDGPLGCERVCDCIAEPLARPTDHGDLIGQAQIHRSSLRSRTERVQGRTGLATADLKYVSVPSTQSWRTGLNMSITSVSSKTSTECSAHEGIWSATPARTIVCSPTTTKRAAPRTT